MQPDNNTLDPLNQYGTKDYWLNIPLDEVGIPKSMRAFFGGDKPKLPNIKLYDDNDYGYLDSKELQYRHDERLGLSNHAYLTKAKPFAFQSPNVVGIEIYRNDVKVIREGFKRPNGWEVAKRSEVVEFSTHSRQRLSFVGNNTQVDFLSMITLTYPRKFPMNGRICKWHLRRFLKDLELKFNGIEWLWYVEFQGRDALHFHIMTDCNIENHGQLIKRYRKGRKVDYFTVKGLHDWATRQWVRIVHKELTIYRDTKGNEYDKQDCENSRELVAHWQPDMTLARIKDSFKSGVSWEKVRDIDGAKRYITKYAMKMEQKIVPDGFTQVGRFWGGSKGVLKSVKPIAKLVGLADMIKGVFQRFDVHEAVKALVKLPRVIFNAGQELAKDLETVRGLLIPVWEFREHLSGWHKPVELREVHAGHIQRVMSLSGVRDNREWWEKYLDCENYEFNDLGDSPAVMLLEDFLRELPNGSPIG